MVKKKIDIPDSAYIVKAYWKDEPPYEVVEEIHQWIREGNPNYLWRGHTHTKPSENANIVFIGEFRLPERLAKNKDNWYPCPCCHPEFPQFKGTDNKPGLIVWFPDEGVIRLMGNYCFSTRNPEGFEKAKRQWRRKKEFDAQILNIANNSHNIPLILRAIEKNIPIARAVDRFHKLLHLKIKKLNLLSAINEISQGQLHINVEELKIVKSADGKEQFITDHQRRLYASFDGYKMLVHERKTLVSMFEEAQKSLCLARDYLENLDCEIASSPFQDIKKISSSLSSGLKKTQDAEAELLSLRRFLSPTTMNTLNAWCQLEGTPVKLFIERIDNKLNIGCDNRTFDWIPISKSIDELVTNIRPSPEIKKSVKKIKL